MMRWLTLLVVCIGCLASGEAATLRDRLGAIQTEIEKTIREADPTALVGMEVVSLKKGVSFYRRNEERRFIPASNIKLFVAAAALDVLGVTRLLRSERFYRKLPLLKYTANLFPIKVLEGMSLICAQHLVSTTYTMFHHFFDLGLDPKNLYVIGKCYSTDQRIYKQLIREGVNVSNLSTRFDSHESYDERYRLNISRFFSESVSRLSNPKKLLLLDDGGYLLKFANETLPDKALVAGVEQTSAGYRLLRSTHLNFPIINVARSKAKLHYESPIIAQLVCDRLFALFRNLLHIKPKVLIIGYGFIGKAILSRLKKIKEIPRIDVYDPYKKVGAFPENELNKYIGDYDVIIGCSGTTVLSDAHYSYLKRPVYLVSASSSDREFDSVKLRCAHRKTHSPHKCLNIKGIHLVNCGFPYPFDSCYDKIDLTDFQLTRSLLLGAVVQACTTSSKRSGLISLSSSLQGEIIKKYLELGEDK